LKTTFTTLDHTHSVEDRYGNREKGHCLESPTKPVAAKTYVAGPMLPRHPIDYWPSELSAGGEDTLHLLSGGPGHFGTVAGPLRAEPRTRPLQLVRLEHQVYWHVVHNRQDIKAIYFMVLWGFAIIIALLWLIAK